MVRYAILINTNTSARQLKRIVEKLSNSKFHFYIHVDKKLNIKHYRHIFELKNVFEVTGRIAIKPGGYSSVKATLNGIRQILETDIDYDFVTLLNGRDYPIKSADEIIAFLRENDGKQFIKFDKKWVHRHLPFVNKYHLIDHQFPGKRFIESLMNIFFKKPKAP